MVTLHRILVGFIFMMLLAGCGSHSADQAGRSSPSASAVPNAPASPSLFVPPTLPSSATSSSSPETQTPDTADLSHDVQAEADIAPRALGVNGAEGEFKLVPKGKEDKQRFDVISCMFVEGDYQFTGDYDVLYLKSDGTAQLVDSLSDLTVIQPNDQAIAMTRLDFGSFAAFVLIPQYKDCHGLEFHLYGVADGKAFPFEFEWEGEKSAAFATDPVEGSPKPRVVQGQLVVDGGYAAGMDNRTRYTFEPDVATHSMKLVKEEPLPVSEEE